MKTSSFVVAAGVAAVISTGELAQASAMTAQVSENSYSLLNLEVVATFPCASEGAPRDSIPPFS